jgi:hypothetical protein
VYTIYIPRPRERKLKKYSVAGQDMLYRQTRQEPGGFHGALLIPALGSYIGKVFLKKPVDRGRNNQKAGAELGFGALYPPDFDPQFKES